MLIRRFLRLALLVTVLFTTGSRGAPAEFTYSPLLPAPSQNSSSFPWPKDPSELFEKISNLPREDIVAKIKAVVEPVTKDTLTQLTPDFLRTLTNKPKDEMVEYVSGVLPAPKSVVSQLQAILGPASDLLSPAARSVSAVLADLAGRTGDPSETSSSNYKPKSAIRAAASAASNRAILLAVNAARTILAIAFEPLMVAHLSLVLDEPQLQGNVSLDNLLINNVSTFVLESIDSDPSKLTGNFSVTLQEFNVTGHYDMDCTVTNGHRLFGAGDFTVTVRNLKIDGTVQLGIENLFLHVDDLQLSVSMEELKLQVQRLLQDDAISRLASGVISDVGPHFLEEFQKEVGSILSAQVAAHLNKLLSIFSIPMILDRLKVRGEDVLAARMRSTTMAPIHYAAFTNHPRIDKEETEEESLSKSSGSKEETIEEGSEDDFREMWEAEIKKHALWLEERARRKQNTT